MPAGVKKDAHSDGFTSHRRGGRSKAELAAKRRGLIHREVCSAYV